MSESSPVGWDAVGDQLHNMIGVLLLVGMFGWTRAAQRSAEV